MKYTLKKPISMGEGEPVTELTFREDVVAGDLRGVPMRDPPHFEDLLKIAGRLTGQPEVIMNRLGMADMQEVLSRVSGFMDDGPKTGPAPSP